MQNMEKEEVEAIFRLNEQGRCVKCKRRNDGMITCERCKEFNYCSIGCLEDDRPMHKIACDVIGIKKGYLVLLTEEETQREKIVKEKARPLTEDGLIKTEETSLKRDKTQTRSDLSSRHNKSSIPKQGKDKTKKGRNGNGKKAGLHKIVNGSKENDEKNSAECLVASGRFGGPVKVSSKQESGERFGEDWWKGEVDKPKKEKQKLTSKATSAANPKAKLKFKDYYSDSEESSKEEEEKVDPDTNGRMASRDGRSTVWPSGTSGQEIKDAGDPLQPTFDAETAQNDDSDSEDEADKNELKSNIQEGASSESNLAVQSDGAMKQTGMELVKYDPKKAEEEIRRNQNRPAPGKCFYCKKEGRVLKCSRCSVATYCGKACQLAHYEQHKGICRLKDRFETALGKIPEILIITLRIFGGPYEFSPLLDDILNPIAAMFLNLRNNVAVVVEIVAEHPHPTLYGAIVRDTTGRLTQVLFFVNTLIYKHTTHNLFRPIVPIFLPLCLQPGNFIVLLKPAWSVLPDGKPGICVDDLENVHFVFTES